MKIRRGHKGTAKEENHKETDRKSDSVTETLREEMSYGQQKMKKRQAELTHFPKYYIMLHTILSPFPDLFCHT